ncbi:MAG: hypothetical protein U0441_08535 [Polyangiaceae bacterium]
MTRKLGLPVILDANRKPTVDAVRAKLGGRASTERGAGEFVVIDAGGGFEHSGIVLFRRDDEIAVWTSEGVVRRASRADVRKSEDPTPAGFADVAADAAVFGQLMEGQRVRYRNDSGTDEGTLVEKCKFGALVERDDRTIVGVSFRRLWPAETN